MRGQEPMNYEPSLPDVTVPRGLLRHIWDAWHHISEVFVTGCYILPKITALLDGHDEEPVAIDSELALHLTLVYYHGDNETLFEKVRPEYARAAWAFHTLLGDQVRHELWQRCL
jgi:hypothetical protein